MGSAVRGKHPAELVDEAILRELKHGPRSMDDLMGHGRGATGKEKRRDVNARLQRMKRKGRVEKADGPDWVLVGPETWHDRMDVLLAVVEAANDQRRPKATEIAFDLEMSLGDVNRHLRKLEAEGFIEPKHDGRGREPTIMGVREALWRMT